MPPHEVKHPHTARRYGNPSMTRVAFLILLPAFFAGADDIQTITISTPPGQMKYDRPVIKASPGAQLKLMFALANAEQPPRFIF